MDTSAPTVTPIVTLGVEDWRPVIPAADTERYAHELEAGAVLVLPRLTFVFAPDETRFLNVRWSDGKAKNISLDGTSIRGAAGGADDLAALARMIGRFAADATALVTALFPRYAHELEAGAVLVLPRLAFKFAPDETRFLNVRWSDGKAKNISLDGTSIR
ncbi:MAG: Kdo hydroxylase family protein, partial [Casimicrobiaceae bacterium]